MRQKILYYEFSCGRWGGWERSYEEHEHYIVESGDVDDILEFAARYGYRPVLVN